MILLVPQGYDRPVRDSNGIEYPVENGRVEMPDGSIHSGLWSAGFVVAPILPKPEEIKKAKNENG